MSTGGNLFADGGAPPNVCCGITPASVLARVIEFIWLGTIGSKALFGLCHTKEPIIHYSPAIQTSAFRTPPQQARITITFPAYVISPIECDASTDEYYIAKYDLVARADVRVYLAFVQQNILGFPVDPEV